MLKKIVSLLICLTLAIPMVFPCTVSASSITHTLELTEGEKIWLDAQSDLLGVDIPSWSMNWSSNSNDIIILQKTYDSRQCLVQAVNRTADIYYIVELTYKTLLSSGFYQTNWVTFKIKIKCSHNFTGGTVITPPTAGTEGVMKGYCSKCNAEMTKKIPALGYENFTDLEFSDATFDYDGTQKSISINTVPDGATVTYSSETANQNKATNAGVYKIKATVSHPDYNDWVKEATLKINPKELTITGLTAQDKIYDGTDKANLSGGALSGKVGNDDVSATIPTESKFADKNVGDNKSVTINTIALSGAKKDNYTLTQPNGLKANITQKVISVTADNQTMIKNGTMPTLTYTADK